MEEFVDTTSTEAPPLPQDDPLSSLPAYTRHCVFLAGSNVALAKILQFSTGSRIGEWLSGEGRPSPLTALRMAEFSGHDVLAVLRVSGHTEMADIIERGVAMRRGLPTVYKERLEDVAGHVEHWLQEIRQYKNTL